MKISEILLFLEGEGVPFAFSGDAGAAVEGFSSLARYKPGSFTWIKKQGNIPEGFGLSQIALAFVSEDVDAGAAPNIIRTAQSKRAFFSSIEHFYAREEARPAVGQSTYISPEVKLGKDVRIGHNCTLDGDITVGDGTVVWNNVVIVGRVRIGRDCEIASGTVIGHDGFGYTEDAAHKKTMVRHFGGVDIGDRQLYGSCRFGKNAYFASGIIKNQKSVGEDAFVGMGAVVLEDVPPGETVVGNPARPLVRKKG